MIENGSGYLFKEDDSGFNFGRDIPFEKKPAKKRAEPEKSTLSAKDRHELKMAQRFLDDHRILFQKNASTREWVIKFIKQIRGQAKEFQKNPNLKEICSQLEDLASEQIFINHVTEKELETGLKKYIN